MELGCSVPRLRVRLPMLLSGLLLVAAFYGLDRTSNTLRIEFIPPWDASSRGELYFWLGALLFLLPGATLLGASFAELLRPSLLRLHTRLLALDARERLVMCLLMGVVGASLARLGNQLVLVGQPFTDDEDAVRFGGQVLATGSLWAPLPPLRSAFPDRFLLQQHGQWTSFDFLGALLPWTFSELTRTDTLIFSLFAGLLPMSVALACSRRQGAFYGLVGGVLSLCSPMAATLSMTSHTHVVSRGSLALGLGLVLFVERAGVVRSTCAGAALGLAFITRPAETFLLLLPLACYWSYQAFRDPSERPRLLGLALGFAPVAIAMLAYDHALTGSFGFPRGAPNEIVSAGAKMMRGPFETSRFLSRFGSNFSYNLLTLSLWFLGPLGLLLAWLGAKTSRIHACLGAGLLLEQCLTLLHDDRGLHMVGPIHLSEMAVPLVLLVVAGLPVAIALLERVGIMRAQSWTGLLGYTVVGCGLFVLHHANALQEQALSHLMLMEYVEHVPKRPAVVLVGDFYSMRTRFTQYGSTGSFVFEWRRARPDLSDPVLVIHDTPEARAGVEQAFPQRAAYVLDAEGDKLALRSVRSLMSPQ